MRALIDVNWSQPGISNHSTFAELASSLQRMISRYAETIEVIRCDAAKATCGAPETIVIGTLPEDPPGTPFDGVSCDNRPIRHLAGAPKNHATAVGLATIPEKIRGFGHVKARHLEAAKKEEAALLAKFRSREPQLAQAAE